LNGSFFWRVVLFAPSSERSNVEGQAQGQFWWRFGGGLGDFEVLDAERLRRTAGTAWPKNRQTDYERILQTLRSSLSEQEFSRSWASGRAFSREEAIAAAMVPDSIT
jgi:hypothetical protein